MAHIYGGQNVSLFIFHGTKNLDFIKAKIPDWTNVQFIDLKVEALPYPQGYNTLLVQKSFYKNFTSEFVLIFQTDSIIRHKIPDSLFEFDYIGAPWAHNPIPETRVGNGGFSLRKVKVMIEFGREDLGDGDQEDLYFARRVKNIPNSDIAKTFSSEMITADDPVGIHSNYKYLPVAEVVRLLAGTAGLKKIEKEIKGV